MSALDQAVAMAFPSETIRSIDTLAGTGETAVGRVTTDRGSYVVKCAPTASALDDLRREVAVTNTVRQTTDVPVVDFLDVELGPVRGRPAYYVANWVTGRNLGDLLDSTPGPMAGVACRTLGALLAELHDATSFAAPGDLGVVDEQTVEVRRTRDWPAQFRRRLDAQVAALSGTRFEELAAAVEAHVSDRVDQLEAGESAVLLHGDVGDGNVVCDGTDVAALLDWEFSFAGHPEYDLCRAETRYFWNHWGGMEGPQSMLYEGYRERRSLAPGFEDRRTSYLATFSLSPLRSFESWGLQFSDDLDDLADSLETRIRGIFET